MPVAQGYYDGNTVVVLDKLDAQMYQKVQIVPMDGYIDAKQRKINALERFCGAGRGVFDGVDPVEYQRSLREER